MGFISMNNLRPERNIVCPTNGKAGRRLDIQTIKAMLELPCDVLRDVEYRFCADPNCLTVYCYCFRRPVGEIEAAGRRALTEINRGVKDGWCACDIRNPRGVAVSETHTIGEAFAGYTIMNSKEID